MSKTSLKRALNELDAGELRRVVLDLYEARKEARAWLDFFAEPNEGAALHAFATATEKEWARAGRKVRRHNRTPRITLLRRLLKDLEGLSVSPETMAEAYITAVEAACHHGHDYLTPKFQDAMAKLVEDAVDYHAAHGLLRPEVIDKLRDESTKIPSAMFFYGTRFREVMVNAITRAACKYYKHE